ncbi:MAG: J domain-containing protein [Sphingomonadaceae bacterium]|nr:J domain-containing protein [Sphingomonadaceae bacterium]
MKFVLFLALLGALYWLLKSGASVKAMPRDAAAKLLGVAPDADAGAVADAHRRLIARVHPDAGGSAELAAQINRARDAMLR